MLDDEEQERWEEIKSTFGRNLLLQGADEGDPVGRVVGQLSLFSGGLESIQKTLNTALTKPRTTTLDLGNVGESLEALRETVAAHLQQQQQAATVSDSETTAAAPAQFEGINENLVALRTAVESYLNRTPQAVERGGGENIEALANYLGEGLNAVCSDITNALAQLQSNVEAERMDRVSRQVEAVQNSMTGLRDLLAQNREGLKTLQVKAQSAAPETVLELNQELIGNTDAMVEAILKQIEQLQKVLPKCGIRKNPTK